MNVVGVKISVVITPCVCSPSGTKSVRRWMYVPLTVKRSFGDSCCVSEARAFTLLRPVLRMIPVSFCQRPET